MPGCIIISPRGGERKAKGLKNIGKSMMPRTNDARQHYGYGVHGIMNYGR
jgi:hypothetical protein